MDEHREEKNVEVTATMTTKMMMMCLSLLRERGSVDLIYVVIGESDFR